MAVNILIIGSGGREHATVWKLRQCASVKKIWCAPGNGGISNDGECLPVDLNDVEGAASLAARLGADLTIVGPELPLVLGIADEFRKRGLALLGPAREAAQLEGSKVFAKQFMRRHRIPTASVYGIFDSARDAHAALDSVDWPLVIKADGLCAGKGVLVTSSRREAGTFIDRLIEQHEFGDAGSRVLLEESLPGDELSYIILTDGNDFISLAPTRDHKRARDNDEGPNTGGMGAYSTDDIVPPELESKILDTIVRPTLDALRQEGIPYRGFLYFGLMLTPAGPRVLEYNCRLGDPETEAILLRADFDLAAACMNAARGNLGRFAAKWSRDASVSIVIASEGYPGDPKTGRRIDGLGEAAKVPGSVVLHAGTRRDGGEYYTCSGRVLVVSARGGDLAAACRVAYDAVSRIKFDGAHFRSDIGCLSSVKSQAAADPPAG
jgi:phosphoribosylamine--glycine ligase